MTVADEREGWGRQRFRRRKVRLLAKVLGSAVLGIGTLGYSYFIEPFWLEVTHTAVRLPNLPPSFDGLRLVVISDIHYGWRVGERQLRRVVERTNAQQPDVICLLGDYVTRRAGYRFPTLLARLVAKEGIFAVLGNHDYFGHEQANVGWLQSGGAQVLRNQHATLEREGAHLHFAGVEDLRSHNYDLPAALRGLPGTECRVLLAHNPDFVDRIAGQRVDLMLCGHTHGGQVILPFFGAPHLPHKHEELLRGYCDHHGLPLYVSRGIGMSGIPHRLRARPEIAVLTLHRALKMASCSGLQGASASRSA